MMELLKKHIHMNRRRGNVTSQMTLDDDFNVPDSMDDVEELIMENGEVKIEAVKNPGEKAEISGKLEFRIRECRGRLQAGAGTAAKWRMRDELHISSGMFGRDALLRLDE